MSVQLTAGFLPTNSITNLEINSNANLERSKFAINVGELKSINPLDWRVHDAIGTNLPVAASADDLACVTNTFGTSCPVLKSGDGGTTTLTQRARTVLTLPPEYVAGETVSLKFLCGMLGTTDDYATLDVEAYLIGDDGNVSGSDLYTGAAKDIDSLTIQTQTFALTPTNLTPGCSIDVRITVAIHDTAGSGKIAVINKSWLASDNRG